MVRIYADINNRDEKRRVRLNTVGAERDIASAQEPLEPGKRVMLYMDDEFEVEATLEFEKIWLGCPDWSTLRYY
jgi:hypothetical protein